MMSYTIPCTSLCSRLGTLMRRTSPCTRIMGGSPAERCKSEALFLTEKASSSAISMLGPLGGGGAAQDRGGALWFAPRKFASIMSTIHASVQATKRQLFRDVTRG